MRGGTHRALDLVVAILLAALVFGIYRLTGGAIDAHQSSQPHFVLLASALLHGHLWVDPTRAVHLGDITPYAGRYYVSFPPMPALLMLPFVAVQGSSFNDAAFTVVVGAINAGLAYLLIRRLGTTGMGRSAVPVGPTESLVLALLLSLGTVQFYSALAGTVWFTAHVVAVGFLLLYLLECAGRGRPLVAGAALAAAFLARTPTIFGAIFWCILALRESGHPEDVVRRALRFGAPLVAAAALLLGQNVARFGSPLDFGYLSMRIADQLRPDLLRYGQFSTHFLPRNLEALFVTTPVVDVGSAHIWLAHMGGLNSLWTSLQLPSRLAGHPFPVQFDPWGTGLWAVTPAFIFALRRPRREHLALYIGAWVSVILIALPDVLYYNTGWYQYGNRFSLDYTPFLLVLTALGLRRPLAWQWKVVFGLLSLVSVASNVLGARWFLHLPPY